MAVDVAPCAHAYLDPCRSHSRRAQYHRWGGMNPTLIARAQRVADRVAVGGACGESTFGDLLQRSERRARGLLVGRKSLAAERVAYLVPPGAEHVATLWAIWRAGGVAVPLCLSGPPPEWERILADARPRLLLATEEFLEPASDAAAAADQATGTPEVLGLGELDARAASVCARLPEVLPHQRALMVYTSGTTGRPKGVVTTHATVDAQVSNLVEAWEWCAADRILHVLPLHHVHGIINAMCCAQWSGACCEFHAAADLGGIWDRLAGGEVTLFMAVPTIYQRLITEWDGADAEMQRRWANGAAGLRLMVSGSAALPVDTLERWEAITGQRLLERYGMTEIGMALGNPLHGERRAGTVGQPFDGVEARVVDDQGCPSAAGEQGEIEVRGAQVFAEYWGQPEATRAAFRSGDWFRTGDEAIVDGGYWRIVGRRGLDIIKTGGYKVSALEIEAVLRQHPAVADVAVVGVPDEEWGERVCAALLLAAGSEASGDDIRAWCKQQLAPYKVPKDVRVVDDLPRNAMGKVLKTDLRRVFTDAA